MGFATLSEVATPENKTGGAGMPSAISDRWIACGLLFLTLVLYARTAGFDFINLDDTMFVTENQYVRAGLTADSIRWALTTSYINWQPLVYLSHMAVVTVFGMDPAAHHLLNALLHALNAAIFFLVLRRMRLPVWSSAAAAAIFAVHPLRIESVAWVTERKDVLSSLLWLLTMWAYVRYTEAAKERGRYLSTVACFALGLMAKPMLVTLPVALLILDFWPLKRWKTATIRGLILEKAPLAALAGVVAAATIVTQQAAGAMASMRDLPLDRRLANVIRSYAIYLWKTVWPTDLAILYPFPASFPAIEIAAAVVVVAGISYWVWVRRNTAPWWLAGWLWYLIVLAPTIGFIPVGPQPYADRYTYLPSLLPLAVVAVTAESKLGPALFRGASAVITLVLLAMSWIQLGTWRDDLTLYRHAIAAAPGASLVHQNLGVALEKLGRYNEAIANYETAQRLNEYEPGPPLNMGLAYLLSGRPERALKPLARAVELQPAAPGPLYHYSRALLAAGKLDEAVAEARKALALSPAKDMAASLHLQLGMAAYMRKDDQAALAEFTEALRLDPEYGTARKNAGIALGNMGRNREAIEQFEIYMAANPQDKDVAAAIIALRAGAR
ncbi:MAG: tetratricopeptide repeat protein [Bryobacteraceae bacterium]